MTTDVSAGESSYAVSYIAAMKYLRNPPLSDLKPHARTRVMSPRSCALILEGEGVTSRCHLVCACVLKYESGVLGNEFVFFFKNQKF